MLYAIAYAVVALVVGLAVSAYQRAVLAGPAWVKAREHIQSCHVCEWPSWFWVAGYDCGGIHGRPLGCGGMHPFPFSLSPWHALLSSLFWPGKLVLLATTGIRDRAAARLAAHVEARYHVERDRAEIDRLVKELP